MYFTIAILIQCYYNIFAVQFLNRSIIHEEEVMAKKSLVSVVILVLLFFGIAFSQQHRLDPDHHMEGREFRQEGKLPVSLEIDKLTDCPIEVVELNLGKIKVRHFRNGSSNRIKKVAGAYDVKAAVIKASLHDVQPIIKWFHRLRKKGELERKTVRIVFASPGTQNPISVNLWYAWPSDITIKQEGDYPAAYITFEADDLKMEYSN